MKQWLDKIIEKIVINAVWNILKLLGAAAMTGALVWINANMQTDAFRIIASILLCAAGLVAFFILKSRFGSRYPKFRWDTIHGGNRYVISFKTREQAEYTKTIEAIPLRDRLEFFPAGDYVWTGDGSLPRIDPEDTFSLQILDGADAEHRHYIVKPKNTVKQYEKNRYTIYIDLHDSGCSMQPRNSIFIKRPTKQITLELTIPSDIPIKNVRYKAKTKFGEESTFIDQKGEPRSTGGKTIGSTQYIFTVKRPKLFCEYEICWEWDNMNQAE